MAPALDHVATTLSDICRPEHCPLYQTFAELNIVNSYSTLNIQFSVRQYDMYCRWATAINSEA